MHTREMRRIGGIALAGLALFAAGCSGGGHYSGARGGEEACADLSRALRSAEQNPNHTGSVTIPTGAPEACAKYRKEAGAVPTQSPAQP